MKLKFKIYAIQRVKEISYKIYKKVQNNIFIVNIINYLYIFIFPYFKKSTRPCKYDSKKFHLKNNNQNEIKDIANVKVAFICDEMTYRCFSTECESTFLTPNNWLTKLTEFKPDILFCESTWSGIKEYEDCWRGRIYKNNNLRFENRKVLMEILDYCKRANIKTVFWNKEDPIFFEHKIYNFVDTALHFDYIFTTAKECVEKYKTLGHKNVSVLMFGFSPKIFNPLNSRYKEDVCIFAGSWYSDQPQRCNDMNKMLNLILKEKLNFKIYDRQYNSGNPVHRFPKEYESYLNGGMNFTELNTVIKKARYAVNINTVTSSETMFARRVFETMACNTCIISNYSKGLEKLFGDNIWFLDKEFDKSLIEEKCNQNVDIVFKNHTYQKRLKEILNTIGFQYTDSEEQVKIIYINSDYNKCQNHFKSLKYKNKKGFMLSNSEINSMLNKKKSNIKSFCEKNKSGYFVIIDLDHNTNDLDIDLEIVIAHFSYIDESVGIRKCSKSNSVYEYITDNININTVYNTKMMQLILNNHNTETTKYFI